ncbi:AAA family ATPase [Microcoleus sp. FACHB-672]|uniref:AAA family ATPase n=1 Tax=Microcoleus sp. FACHB-672 TaxID=2692825 RepID=UPI0016827BAC|nr:AAA family ATPase [Microcoleus sp. FACHB-672]MBD2043593.1 AAA family ATPase [Microcoleus sp. FACHB-672]
MRVKRLKMQSFRGIGNLTLEFPTDEPTVFIGINGVGKSSILDCIAILFSPYIDLIRVRDKINFEDFRVDSNSIDWTSRDIVRLLYRNHLPGERESNTLISRFFSNEDIKNGQIKNNLEITTSVGKKRELNWSLSSKKPLIDSTELYALVLLKILNQPQLIFEKNLPLVIYYPSNRELLDIPLDISSNFSFDQLDAYKSAVAGVQIVFDRFFQWFRALEDLENEERLDNSKYKDKQLEAVRKAIYALIPNFSNLRVRRSPLRMTVKKQGQELILNQLSDGEKCLLAMVGDLARRLALANPDLEDPLEGAGVVLIDEIELHLHPEWQRKIMPALSRTFPNCQFIVTTHSPQVLSQVKPESIYILERTDEGEIVATRPESSSFGRDSNRILEDLMGVSERPKEIKEEILELFRVIDAGNLDLARQLRQEIAEKIGLDDPELVKAGVSIRRREILKK